jgi:hypothetical protein
LTRESIGTKIKLLKLSPKGRDPMSTTRKYSKIHIEIQGAASYLMESQAVLPTIMKHHRGKNQQAAARKITKPTVYHCLVRNLRYLYAPTKEG